VTTINLDEDGAPMRQISRTSCQLKAICVADGHTFESVITDISTVGMFIKSPPEAYPAGKPIRVSCRLPGREKALVLNGEVLRGETAGIAVRLTGLSDEQETAIRQFILNRL
ncbi:MAG: PilZ domain-containing protein, partial [Syntrophobacterales bacterium]